MLPWPTPATNGVEHADECVCTSIVLNLKSSGADSSLLTLGVRKIVTATLVGHSEQHVIVLAE
ncbi:MAG TPA: hypothetical protein VGK01_10040 [Candidatus Angelobacter sp.]|jgi:hypothetical protein